jgi:hypothetical protein
LVLETGSLLHLAPKQETELVPMPHYQSLVQLG